MNLLFITNGNGVTQSQLLWSHRKNAATQNESNRETLLSPQYDIEKYGIWVKEGDPLC